MVVNIEKETLKNKNYRKVIHTDKFQQTVIMSIGVGGDIPKESHHGSQFFRIESGTGYVEFGGKKYRIKDGSAFTIPPDIVHYIKNTNKEKPLKLYTIYSPPQHAAKLVQRNADH